MKGNYKIKWRGAPPDGTPPKNLSAFKHALRQRRDFSSQKPLVEMTAW
jgi:hypothetical protein